MPTQVIVLNGGSNSGKSSIARCLQSTLPDPWLTLGVDTLIQTMPRSMQGSGSGIQFAPAEWQADLVHNGVRYDLEVDTTTTAAIDCARAIAAHTKHTPPVTS